MKRTDREIELEKRFEKENGKYVIKVINVLENHHVVSDYINPDDVAHKVKLDIMTMIHNAEVKQEIRIMIVPKSTVDLEL